MEVDRSSLKTLQKLYVDFKQIGVYSAAEYLDRIDFNLTPKQVSIFLQLAKHQVFLSDLVTDFLNYLNPVDKPTAEVIIFLVLFLLNDDNLDTILECFIQMNCFYVCDLLGALADASRHLKLCQTACRHFADDYVLEQIMDPFLNKMPTIIQLGRKFLEYYEIKQAPSTKPKPFSFLEKHYRRNLVPPSNTPAIRRRFKATKVPKTTYETDKQFERKMSKLKEDNHRRAQQLIIQASQISDRLTKCKLPPQTIEKLPEVVKPKPPPVFKPVQVRGNLTTTLREASRLVKIHKDEVKKIDDLLQGGCNTEDIELLEEQLRKESEQKQLEVIEANHLKGLLSHEEAAIAKRRLIDNAKTKMEKFKEEKVEWLQALNQWKEEEELKIRTLVEKSQTIKQNAKLSEQKMIEKKQELVKALQQETRQLLEQALAERNRELSEKIDLIQEIKALHRVRCNLKEFDPTETPNLGLLCEMSIAELRERLAITRMEAQKELEEKKQNIMKRKKDHKTMIENVERMILENRKVVRAVPKKNRPEVVDSPQLVELRRKLEEKRRLREEMC